MKHFLFASLIVRNVLLKRYVQVSDAMKFVPQADLIYSIKAVTLIEQSHIIKLYSLAKKLTNQYINLGDPSRKVLKQEI